MSEDPKASIEVLHPGDAVNFAKRGDEVRIHYTGTLAANGFEFDSSRKRDKEFKTPVGVGRVIKGWDWACQKISLGERIKLTIEAEWAYGQNGAGGVIPPGATLVFDMQLLQINDLRMSDTAAIKVNEDSLEPFRAAKREALEAQRLADEEAWRSDLNSIGNSAGSGQAKKSQGFKSKKKKKKKKKNR